jgi:uncharacterized protein YxjI
MSDPFDTSVLRVEQPRRGSFAKSRYRVMDGDGTLLAVAEENDKRGLEKLKAFFPGKSQLNARAVLLTTPEGTPLLVVDKQVGRMLTTVVRPGGEIVGTFRTERVGRLYKLRDGDNKPLCEILVDLGRNNFTISDTDGSQVGQVRKKFNGLATHLFTTADKYAVKIEDRVPEPLRTMVVTAAIAMDLTLHESTDVT